MTAYPTDRLQGGNNEKCGSGIKADIDFSEGISIVECLHITSVQQCETARPFARAYQWNIFLISHEPLEYILA